MGGERRHLAVAAVVVVAGVVALLVGASGASGAERGHDMRRSLVGPAPADVTTTTMPCSTVQALLDARFLQDALAGLVADPDCATTPDRVVVEERLGRVAGLVAQSRSVQRSNPVMARTLALRAAEIDASAEEPRELLASLSGTPTTSADPLAAARALDELGYHVDARAAAKEAVKKDPSLLEPDEEGESARGLADPWPSPSELLIERWTTLLIWLGILVFGGLLGRRLVQQWRGSRSPTLYFAPGATGDGPVMAALTRAHLERISGPRIPSLQLAGISSDEAELPKLGELDERLKVVDAIFGLVVRPNTITVTPALSADVASGASGCRVAAIGLDGRAASRSTSWQVVELNDNAGEVDVAAAFGAGWTLATLGSSGLIAWDPVEHEQVTPESHGYLHAGTASLLHGDVPAARQYFANAAASAPEDPDALANLAFVIARDRDLENQWIAIRMMLELAGDET